MKRNITTALMLVVLSALLLGLPGLNAPVTAELIGSYLTWEPLWTVDGSQEQQGSRFSSAVALAGDLNDDGHPDAVIGADKWSVGGTKHAAAFVYLGSAGGLSTSASLVLTPTNSDDEMSTAVDGAGDVNGDGVDDLIVGAPGHKEDGINGKAGAAFIYYGSDTLLDGNFDWWKAGEGADAKFGASVAGVGDVNKDGYDDVLIGSPLFSPIDPLTLKPIPELEQCGRAYLFFGGEFGLQSEPLIFEGTQLSAQVGYQVAGIGDVNNDGMADFAVSTPYYDRDVQYDDRGRVWVFYGTDDLTQLIIPDWHASGMEWRDYFGRSIAAAGDVNGDTIGDVLVGANGFDGPSVDNVGAAYVYYGSDTGLAASPAWMTTSNDGYSAFGWALAGLGDVNGDSYDDVAVGAYLYEGDQSLEGQVFLYRGSASGLSGGYVWSAGGDKNDAAFGFSLDGLGDVNHDGYADLIVGAPDYKISEIPVGQANVFYGVIAEETVYQSIYLPFILSNP